MQGVQGPLLRARNRAGGPAPRIFLSARCMASGKGTEDKSWSEIAGDAFKVASTAFGKATKGITDTVGKLLPGNGRSSSPENQSSSQQEEVDPWSEATERGYNRGRELYRPDDFGPLGGGPLGRAAGSMLGGMFGQLGQMMAETSREAAGAKERALSMIQGDEQIRSALGSSIQITPGMESQSTSTSYVNGKQSKQTSLQFLVSGTKGGPASAKADVISKPDGSEDVTVNVRLPDGRIVRVSEDSGRSGGGGGGSSRNGSGATIDVDWKEVR